MGKKAWQFTGVNFMSKNNALWEFIQKDGKPNIQLSFNEVQDITGIEIDHSF